MNTPVDTDPETFEHHVAALLWILSRQHNACDACTGAAVEQHLHKLLDHPMCQSDTLRNTSRGLLKYWGDKGRGGSTTTQAAPHKPHLTVVK